MSLKTILDGLSEESSEFITGWCYKAIKYWLKQKDKSKI